MLLERLEKLPVGTFHYKLLVVTGLGWLFDSMDTGIISFVLPVLAKEWGLTSEQVGMIGSIGLIGMALGAILAGTVADRLGRKKVFAATVILYSVSTGLCAVAWNYESLLVFRFLVGFGLGGELPVAATLMSEYAPSRLRGRFIVLSEFRLENRICNWRTSRIVCIYNSTSYARIGTLFNFAEKNRRG